MTGEFKVQSEALTKEGGVWEGERATILAGARDTLSDGLNQGYNFGYLANLAGLGKSHDQLIQDLVNALMEGEQIFGFFSAALANTALDYDGADDTAASSADQITSLLDDTCEAPSLPGGGGGGSRPVPLPTYPGDNGPETVYV
jgi:hypothetical protein